MKQALWLLAGAAAALALAAVFAGLTDTAAIGAGAVAVMSGLIAATFLWLWWERTTPLALGMALSWAGTAGLAFWGWAVLTGRLTEAAGLLLVPLALQIAGAVLHFDVMESSMGLGRRRALLPVVLAVGAGVLLTKM